MPAIRTAELRARLLTANSSLAAAAKGLGASSWLGSSACLVRGLSPAREKIEACLEDGHLAKHCSAMIDGYECLASFFGALACGTEKEKMVRVSDIRFKDRINATSNIRILTPDKELPASLSFRTGFEAPRVILNFHPNGPLGKASSGFQFRIGCDHPVPYPHLDADFVLDRGHGRNWLSHVDLSGIWADRFCFADKFLTDFMANLAFIDTAEGHGVPDIETVCRMAMACSDRKAGEYYWDTVLEKLKAFDTKTHELFRYNLASLLSRAVGRTFEGIKSIWLIGTVAGSEPVGPAEDIDLLVETYGPEERLAAIKLFKEIDGEAVDIFNSLMAGTGISRTYLIDTSNRILTQEELETRIGPASIPFSSDIPHYRLYPPLGFRN